MGNKQKARQRADQIRVFYDKVKQLESHQVVQFEENQHESIAKYHGRLL